jgi:hypothetical protein
MSYLAHPILLMGLAGFGLALLLAVFRARASASAMKEAMGAAIRVLVTLGTVWFLLGAVVGINHMLVHPTCVAQEAEVRAAKDPAVEKEFAARCNTLLMIYREKE